MDYQVFKTILMKKVRETLTEHTSVYIKKIPKNNGVLLEGLIIREEDKNLAPVIYLEEYYAYWKQGIPVDLLVEKILWGLDRCGTEISVEDDFFRSYEKLKTRIFYKVINYEKNKELLFRVPHRRILDLAMVFYYRIDDMDAAGTILVYNSHLNLWGITKEELEVNARHYTCQNLQAQYLTMAQLAGLEEEELDRLAGPTAVPMYILTNQERFWGAGTFLYPQILEQGRQLLGERFYILPSSVHECILIPECQQYSKQELCTMVREINGTQVEPEEILSDEVYLYDGKTGRILR